MVKAGNNPILSRVLCNIYLRELVDGAQGVALTILLLLNSQRINV